jgi:hypothetical protein
MHRESKKISRVELYEQVWTVPMARLAKDYGLSDVGLAKICKKERIPRPPRGYWARKETGLEPRKIPLPPGDRDRVIEINPSSGLQTKPQGTVPQELLTLSIKG